MRLLQLFEQINRLDEAAIDRYLQQYEGIFAMLEKFYQQDIEILEAIAKQSIADEPDNAALLTTTFDKVVKQRRMVLTQSMKRSKEWVNGRTRGTVELLTRADRITWKLRWDKLAFMSKLVNEWEDKESMDNGEMNVEAEHASMLSPLLLKAHKEQLIVLSKAFDKDVDKMVRITSKYADQLAVHRDKLTTRVTKLRNRANTNASSDSDEADILEKRIQAIASIVRNKKDSITDTGVKLQADLSDWIESMTTHIMQMVSMIPALDNLRFDAQTPDGLEIESSSIVSEWQARMGRYIGPDEVPDDGEVLVEFPDGSQWINLNKSECDAEARSMGHCGNVDWGNDGDRVVSYREPMQHPQTGAHGWIPRLTFILDRHENLGEMKGFKNQRPSAKYHPQIVELLKSDYVKGIKGGGYSPENNFNIDQLDDDVREKLLAEKPELAGKTNSVTADLKRMHELWSDEGSNKISNEVESLLRNTYQTVVDDMWEEANPGGSSGITFQGTVTQRNDSDYVNFDYYRSISHFVREIGSKDLKYAWGVVDGSTSAYLDDVIGDPEMVWDNLTPGERNEIRKWIAANHKDIVADWVEENDAAWIEIDDTDLWYVIINEHGMEIRNAFQQAADYGELHSVMNDMEEQVSDYFSDLPNSTSYGSFSVVPGMRYPYKPQAISLPSGFVITELFEDETSIQRFIDTDMIPIIGSIDEFYYRKLSEIDLKSASKSLHDELSDIGINI
jgi:hypothetical protein